MRTRRIPGTDVELSTVGLSLATDPPAETVDRLRLGLLKRARSRGVTFFDTAPASPSPPAEFLVGRAFEAGEPAIAVGVRIEVTHPIGGGSAEATRPADAGPAPEEIVGPPFSRARLRAVLDEHLRRTGRARADIVELSGILPTDLEEGSLPAHLDELGRQGLLGAWGIYFTRGEADFDLARPAADAGARVASVVHNLLDCASVPRIDVAANGRLAFLARDPHASGRLDGSFLRSPLASRGPRAPPLGIRQWESTFAPVIRLGFLTEGRKRTLGQAALQFALASPRVVTVIPSVTDPTSLDEWTDLDAVAPLSADELGRLGPG